MKNCEQTKNLNVLQHGFSVKNYLFDLLNHLEFDTPLKYEWKIPDFIYQNKDQLLNSLPSRKTLKLATILHDCGKPFCLEIDNENRRHFPDHAKVSYDIFTSLFDDQIAADLILHDMDIHLLKADNINEFLQLPYFLTHLLIGLSEIHSNAKMFGGIESVSFKIKWKSINSRGNQIFKQLNNIK